MKLESRAVYDDLTSNMIPGVILQPTGVYAAHRAQERGARTSDPRESRYFDPEVGSQIFFLTDWNGVDGF
jgi:hypothetical protein